MSPSNHKVNIKLFEFHVCDEVFVSSVVMWSSGTDVSIFIFGLTTEAVRVLGEDGADDKPLVIRW